MLTLQRARDIVVHAALLAPTEQFSLGQQDDAIKHVLARVADQTDLTVTTTTIQLPADTLQLDIAAQEGMEGFEPCRWMGGRIGWHLVELDGFERIRSELACSVPTGRPTRVAFEAGSTATFDKQTDAGYELSLRWKAPLTSWTSGLSTDAAAALELNVAEPQVFDCLYWGGMAALVYGDPDARYSSQAYQRFEVALRRLAGRASNFGGVVTKDPSRYGICGATQRIYASESQTP